MEVAARLNPLALARDADEVAKYVADPLCGFAVTTQAWFDLLGGMLGNEDAGLRARIPKHLPIYIMSGAEDPTVTFTRSAGRLVPTPLGMPTVVQR